MDNEILFCPICHAEVYQNETKCHMCGMSLKDDGSEHWKSVKNKADQIHVKEKEQQLKSQNKQAYIPKCPTCGSPDIVRISSMTKATNVALFGLLGNRRKKTFHCNNCKYEW